ncbi:MAG: prepilin-type N-terminal cleavage/methylation domain-containing protein [Candidatus Eisenbacteria bacterium]
MTSRTGKIDAGRDVGRSGFTLVELMLVITIIAVIVAMAVPFLSHTYHEMCLEDAAMNIRKLMTYGRERALSDGLRYRVVFESKGTRYALEVENHPLIRKGEFVRIEGIIGKSNFVPSGIVIKPSRDEVNLYPDGTIDEAEVYLKDHSGINCLLTTTGATGRVEISKNFEE